jgi:hypothetical protein
VTLEAYASLSFMGEIIEGMRRILESQSTWLRLRPRDAATDDAYKEYIEASPEKRKTMLLWATANTIDATAAGLGPVIKKGEFKPFPTTLMAFGPLGCSGFGTWDVRLLSLRDTVGKKVDLDSPGSSYKTREYIFDALGIRDKVNLTTLGGGARTVQSIKDRTVDVDIAHMTGFARPIPDVIQLMTETRFYMVDATKEGIDGAVRAHAEVYRGMYPYPLYPGPLPQFLGLRYEPVRQPVVYCIGGQNPHFLMAPEADPEVVHEFVSIMLKNQGEFDRYVTGDLKSLKEGFPQVTRPKGEFHPGARRAFEGLGLNYGFPAIVENEARRARAHGQEFYIPDYFQAWLRLQ